MQLFTHMHKHVLYTTAACPSFNINYPPMRTLLCPGDIITYTCAFSSSSPTIPTIYTQWTGSGFQCPATASSAANILTLSQQTGASLNTVPGSCGNLSAVMTSISETCYTSVLTIPTPHYFNGTTVTCRDGNFGTLIGNDTLNIQLACKLHYVVCGCLLKQNFFHYTEGGGKKKVIDTIPKILKIKVQVNPPPPPPPTNTPILDHAP